MGAWAQVPPCMPSAVQRGRLRWVAGLDAEDPGVEDRVGKPCAQFLRKAGVRAWKRPGGASCSPGGPPSLQSRGLGKPTSSPGGR